MGEPQILGYTDEYGDSIRVSGVHFVDFTPTHVVFRDASRRIIVAEEASSVSRLHQFGAIGTVIGQGADDMGGKPNPGTKRDRRLKTNKASKKGTGGKRKR